jgi:hypothetical protein
MRYDISTPSLCCRFFHHQNTAEYSDAQIVSLVHLRVKALPLQFFDLRHSGINLGLNRACVLLPVPEKGCISDILKTGEASAHYILPSIKAMMPKAQEFKYRK